MQEILVSTFLASPCRNEGDAFGGPGACCSFCDWYQPDGCTDEMTMMTCVCCQYLLVWTHLRAWRWVRRTYCSSGQSRHYRTVCWLATRWNNHQDRLCTPVSSRSSTSLSLMYVLTTHSLRTASNWVCNSRTLSQELHVHARCPQDQAESSLHTFKYMKQIRLLIRGRTTRERVYLDRRGHFRSRDKDGGLP